MRFCGLQDPNKGKDLDREGQLATLERHPARSRTMKFVPVFFASQDEQFLPEELSVHTRYCLISEDYYSQIFAFLSSHVAVSTWKLSEMKALARKPVEPLRFGDGGTKKQSGSTLDGVPDLEAQDLPCESPTRSGRVRQRF